MKPLPAALVMFLLALCAPALGATIYVDDNAPNDPGPGNPAVSDPAENGTAAHPYDAIQEGINAAVAGDTVLVKDGTYTGVGNRDIDFKGKAITVRSENGPEVTIIDCQGGPENSHRGFYLHTGETSASVIDGVTVRNGYMEALDGGGIYIENSSPTITNCFIVLNAATFWSGGGDGGGIYGTNSSPTIFNCTIAGNVCGDSGGGARFAGGDPVLTRCVISGNTSDKTGGGIWGGDLTMSNCLITRNTGRYGAAAVECGYGSSTLTNCTVTDNLSLNGSSEFSVSAVSVDGSATAMLTNCIVWGNNGAQANLSQSSTASHCDVQGGLAGTGNMNADPLLTPDGHLTAASPCINAGTSVGAPALDLDKESRPFPPGMGVDIGCDEFTDTDADGLPDFWETRYSPSGNEPTGDPDGDMLTNAQEYELGTSPMDADSDHDGRDDNEELADGTNPIHADSVERVFYVNGSTGDDAYDGISPTFDGIHGPKRSIQAGIDATLDGWGYSVLVADGTYTGSRNRDLDLMGRAITVRSENGAGAVTIDCEFLGRGFRFEGLGTRESVVDGFTIRRANDGIFCKYASPTIRNCVFTGNDDCCRLQACSPQIANCIFYRNTEGCGIYAQNVAEGEITGCGFLDNEFVYAPVYCLTSSPTITDCRFIRNSGTQAGAVYCHSESNPVIEGCIISGNRSSTGGGIDCLWNSRPTVTNCLIMGNVARDGGGLHCTYNCPARVANCAIVNNVASGMGGGIFAGSDPPALDNTIIWGNRSEQIHSHASHMPTLNYCDIEGGWTGPGIGNIVADPLLTPDGHLRAGSPCIDLCPTGSPHDIDGEDRPAPPGGAFDAGADEFSDSDADGLPDWWETLYYAGAGDDPDGDTLTNLEEYEIGGHPGAADTDGDWRNDRQELLDGTDPLHPDNTEGIYYVDANVGDDTWDGLAAVWMSGTRGPKATIQAGIDAALVDRGHRVLVAPGTYSGDGNTNIDFRGKAIAVRGQGGAAVTTVDCGGVADSWCTGFEFQYAETSASLLAGFTIAGNAHRGAGIRCRNTSSPTIQDCLITGWTHDTEAAAGVCCFFGSNPTLANCVISGNSPSLGGAALYCSESDPLFINCTIAWNTGQSAIDLEDSHPTFVNTVIWNEDCQEITRDDLSVPVLRYCVIQGGWGGEGILNADPLFADPASGNYCITMGSPCVDRGTADGAPLTDIDGNPRPAGWGYDIGAYEVVATDGDADGLPDEWETWYFAHTGFTGSDDPDGDGLTNAQEGEYHAGPANADTDHDGRTDGAEAASGTDPCFPDNDERVYYVNRTTGDDSHDGLASAWDSTHGPRRTIQAGMDAAPYAAGYSVHVAPGTYSGPGNTVIDFGGRPIRVQSEQGAEKTTIDCAGEPCAVYFHMSETVDSVLDGFTITGAVYSSTKGHGGAIHCRTTSPTVTNCRILNNNTRGIQCDYGTTLALTSCFVSKNTTTLRGAGIYSERIVAGPQISLTLVNCTVAWNQADDGGGLYCRETVLRMRNCTVVNNVATGDGGGLYFVDQDHTIEDSILWGNAPQQIYKEGGTLTVKYSDVQGGWSGEGNIKLDPKLSPTLRIRTGSPCIDWCPAGAATDSDGEARPFDVPGVGYDYPPEARTFDIGSDEYVDVDLDGLADQVETATGIYADIEDTGTDPSDPDTDSDGLADGDEVNLRGTDPCRVDTDGDGLGDGEEITTCGTDPTKADTDNDGLDDYAEVHTYPTDPTDPDSDDDGLKDGAEILTYHTDPLDADSDDDGLNDGPEVLTYGSDPFDTDSDDDGLTDGDEVHTYGTDPTDDDSDDDGLSDAEEINVHHTNPLDADTDDDTMPDGYEVGELLDPLNVADAWWDADGDLLLNAEEYAFGSGPRDPFSPAFVYVDDDAAGDPVQDGTLEHPYAAIQSGINAAIAPAVVKVLPGTYLEEVLPRDRVWLIGSGAAVTTVDSQGAAEAIFISSANIHVAGFTVKAGPSYTGIRSINSTAVVRDCIATLSHGGLGAGQTGSLTLTNCLSYSNYVNGIWQSGTAALSISNCTVANNGTKGIVRWGTGAVTVTNTISYGNPDDIDGSAFTVSYCDIGNGDYAGTNGNISADPKFVDTVSGDYSLLLSSPCIDTGTSDGAPSADIQGDPRYDVVPVPNTGGGAIPYYDIGADEYVDVDTDADGLPDYWEIAHGLDPNDDGSIDPRNGASGDPDADGLGNLDEYLHGTNPQSPDTDADGIPDGWELERGLDPLTDDASQDPDGDGLTNLEEFAHNTDPHSSDTDHDGMPDPWEIASGLNPLADDAADDPDTDGLPNVDEFHHSTDPHDPDTDGDGRNDAVEVADNSNPLHPDNAEKTYYVDGTAGDNTHDGLTAAWDGTHGPKRTIQAGIDAATGGWNYTVLIADGTYGGLGNTEVQLRGFDVTVCSKNGAASCVIDCAGATSGFYIHASETTTSVVRGFTITNSTSYGINIDRASPTIEDCTITLNTSTGIRSESGSPVITGCAITNNSQGGIAFRYGRAVVDHCVLTGNSKPHASGGAIFYYYAAPTIEDCVMSGNSALAGGGVFVSTGASGRIARCTIVENAATDEGGGLCCRESQPLIERCQIARNTATEGGGLYAISYTGSTQTCHPRLTNCTIESNTASEDGGGIYCFYMSSVTMTNCRVMNNWASGVGGGSYTAGYQTATTITNSIFRNNSPEQIRRYSEVSALTVTYSNVEGGWPGTGNIDANPGLTPAGFLKRTSPCVDWCPAGGPSDDWHGESRPFDVPGVGYDGPPTARTYDIGSDEFVDTDLDGIPDWWEQERFGSPTAADPAGDADADGLAELSEYENGTDPANGDTDSDGRSDGREVNVDETNPLLRDNADKTFYVNGATGNNLFDGLAPVWDGTHGPKKTIQSGINATVSGWGYKVVVADGTYTGSGNKNIAYRGREITVSSENGPASCIIDCEGDGRGFRFYRRETAKTVLSGITIRNGSVTDDGGGINCTESKPTIVGCVIQNCRARNGGGIYGNASSAQVTGCTLNNNAATSYGGGSYFAGGSPSFRDCTISRNEAALSGGGACCGANSSFYDCVVAENTSTGDGGGIHGAGMISGCTITANTSGWGGGVNVKGGTTVVTGCLIAGNSATSDGGGVCSLYENQLRVCNCTIAGNSADGKGGDISCQWHSTLILTNSIVWANTPTSIPDGFQPPATVTYTCIQGGWPGTGNIDADPMFVNAPSGDYHLRPLSPCIDAGDPASDYSKEPMPNGGRINMGAYGNTAEATSTPGDVNGDGDVDLDDLVAVYEGLGGHDPALDLDGDGTVTFADLRLVYDHIPEGERDLGGVSTMWALDYVEPTDPAAEGLDPTQDQSQLDNDGDARTNYEEFIAGTDPTDPASLFAITAVGRPAVFDLDLVSVSWSVVPGKHYQLYCAPEPGPNADWQPVEGGYEIRDGIATQMVQVDPATKRLFFKAEVW